MEDLQSTALDVLNNNNFDQEDKISSLESFLKEAKFTLSKTKRIRTKQDLVKYIKWLREQLEVLKKQTDIEE